MDTAHAGTSNENNNWLETASQSLTDQKIPTSQN